MQTPTLILCTHLTPQLVHLHSHAGRRVSVSLQPQHKGSFSPADAHVRGGQASLAATVNSYQVNHLSHGVCSQRERANNRRIL